MNKKIPIATLLIVCFFVSMFAALELGTAQTPYPGCDVYISPSVVEVSLGTQFRIDVNVRGANQIPVHDYEFILLYDWNTISFDLAADGGFLQPNVAFTAFESAPGVLFVQGITDNGGSTGDGTLAHIWFLCEGAGHTPIFFEFVYLSDPVGGLWVPETVTGADIYQYATPPAWVYFDPPTYTVPICVPFTVNVMVNDAVDLWSYSLRLSYDTAYVDAIDIVDGGLLPPPILDVKLIDDALGIIEYDVTSIGIPPGFNGDGVLATITFHCTGAGESVLRFDSVQLIDSQGLLQPSIKGTAGRYIQLPYWEPLKLQHLVEYPYQYALVDLPFVPPSSPEGYAEIKLHFEDKGYFFDPSYGGTLSSVSLYATDEFFEPGSDPFDGLVYSWWSSNLLEDGTRACLLASEWEDGSGIAMGFVTNLMPPEHIPEVDPYIIYNAEPYFFIDFYWWAWSPIGRIVRWPYWWHNSHNHPNWFWGPYWWWRTYTKAYYLGLPYDPANPNWAYWRPWWGMYWGWVYWRHWYWWSSYFPYDP